MGILEKQRFLDHLEMAKEWMSDFGLDGYDAIEDKFLMHSDVELAIECEGEGDLKAIKDYSFPILVAAFAQLRKYPAEYFDGWSEVY